MEDPGEPSALGDDVAVHLQGCPTCRQWLHGLLQMERAVPLLPVPPTTARSDFLRRFFTAPSRPKAIKGPEKAPKPELPAAKRPAPAIPAPYRLPIPRYRWYAAGAVAAAIMLLVLDGLLLRPVSETTVTRSRPAPDPFLTKLFKCDLNLAKADSPRARIEALEELAQGLHDQTRKLLWRADPKDLLELAQLYQQVVQDGLVSGARKLPADQRQQVLPAVAERLDQTGRETASLASTLPKDTAEALQLLSDAASNASKDVRALMENQKS
jgi:hypothetical protein